VCSADIRNFIFQSNMLSSLTILTSTNFLLILIFLDLKTQDFKILASQK